MRVLLLVQVNLSLTSEGLCDRMVDQKNGAWRELLAVCNSPAVLRVCTFFADADCEVDAHPAVGSVPTTFICQSAAMITTRHRRSEAGNKINGKTMQWARWKCSETVKQRHPAEVDSKPLSLFKQL